MGGKDETTVSQSRVTQADGLMEKIGDCRIHVGDKDGLIHFHDDKAKVKVAIPPDVFAAGWQKLESGQTDQWEFTDLERQTFLHIKLIVSPPPKAGDKTKLDVCVAVEKLEVSDDFAKLKKFCT